MGDECHMVRRCLLLAGCALMGSVVTAGINQWTERLSSGYWLRKHIFWGIASLLHYVGVPYDWELSEHAANILLRGAGRYLTSSDLANAILEALIFSVGLIIAVITYNYFGDLRYPVSSEPQCCFCGYSLRGLENRQCPECGQSF